VITAVEALQLPSAQLTDEEKAAADGLELLIEEHVRKGMGRNGVDLQVGMTNPKVIAEVNQRLKRAGWATQWSPIIERHKLNAALQNLTGFGLNLFPTDESYKEHERKQLS
jgi:hypothetical protein